MARQMAAYYVGTRLASLLVSINNGVRDSSNYIILKR